MSSIPQVPNDVIVEILLHLPPLAYSKESVRTLCRVGLANSRFLAISRLSRIWKPHYEVQWKRSDESRGQSRKSSGHVDWWGMYCARIQLDRTALHHLDAIISQMNARKHIAVQLVNDCGYDVWEAISAETTCVQVSNSEVPGYDGVPCAGLTRRYWAHGILSVISRCRAVNIWLPLASSTGEDISFEKGLAALSAFFSGVDIERIFEEFDRLALNCQEYLRALGFYGDSDPTETVVEICAWMRQRGFVKSNPTNYHHFTSHFPHHVLFKQPVTLPMSLVYVFVCVAKRLGLDARPVAFPNKVLAMVFPSAGDAIYVDVSESATRPILSYTSDLPAMLQAMGLNPVHLAEYATPATTATMLLRATQSVSHTLNRNTSWNGSEHMAARYAIYCAELLLTGNVECIDAPLDGEVVLKNVLRQGLTKDSRDRLDLRLTELEEREQYIPNTTGRKWIEYFTGMAFRHKKFGFFGAIRGWDYDCEYEDEWMNRMRVRGLPRGSNQPFYVCFTHNGHTHYVAEEDIEPVGRPRRSDVLPFIKSNKDFGRWFDGMELTQSGAARFILGPESRLLYPEDNEAGSLFLARAAVMHKTS